ncbi:hypothetical protein LJR027_001572 [Terrabacter sp. LjRoot27]|uniref:hypothetical protein n=1 Tax=Terrabacter sp. LjRoot27 TaxID=3342306 RepID=UPI003ED12780
MQAPTQREFRALARSSPWLFRTLHFTHHRGRGRAVEAWLSRPGRLAVVDADGRRHVSTGVPYARTSLTLDGSQPGWRVSPPQDHEPRWRPDGLVERRPESFGVDYDDPLWGSYDWVAMLDPVELASGTRLTDLAATERHGRETWWAVAVGVEGYEPRCPCCPLLWGAESVLATGSPDTPLRPPEDYPEWLVGLDRQTGVVVSCAPVGDAGAESGFHVEIHEVDGPMSDELFTAN